MASWWNYCYLNLGLEVTVKMLDRIKDLGFACATRSGLSVGLDDMVIPETKYTVVRDAEKQVIAVQQQYLDGAITNGERNNKVIQIWSAVTEKVADEMFDNMKNADKEGAMNPIYIMADSGARGSKQQIRQLSGMRGLMAKPSGKEIIETPITANFREGLTVLQYFISTHGARKGLADTALKTADSRLPYPPRLVDVAPGRHCQRARIAVRSKASTAVPIVESGEIIEPLRDHALSAVSRSRKIKDFEGQVIVDVEPGNHRGVRQLPIQGAGIEKCENAVPCLPANPNAVSAFCAPDVTLLPAAWWSWVRPVGVIAARSIGEPGTQLTMRTFHIGGTASRVSQQSSLDAKNHGTVRFLNMLTVRAKSGDLVAMIPVQGRPSRFSMGAAARRSTTRLSTARQAQGRRWPAGATRASTCWSSGILTRLPS